MLNSSPRVAVVFEREAREISIVSHSLHAGTPRRKPIPSTNIDNNRLQSTIPEAPGAVRLKIPSLMTPKKSKIEGSSSYLPKRFISRGDPEWIKDEDVKACMGCSDTFTMLLRKHHCRYCGRIYCM